MKIRPTMRAMTLALISAATVAALDGCTAVKKISPSQPAATAESPSSTKEYNWQDMSTGKSFFRPIKPTPQ